MDKSTHWDHTDRGVPYLSSDKYYKSIFPDKVLSKITDIFLMSP